MKIQNYQSYQNNQPRFKANTVVTLNALQDVLGKTPDIYEQVAKMANNGATRDTIVRVKDGYLAPDSSTFNGGILAKAKRDFAELKNSSAEKFSELAADIDSLAEEIASSKVTERI